MELKRIKGTNATQIRMSNGVTVLYSYSTPVALCIGHTYYRTNKRWSVTTSKHINKWLDGVNAISVDQAALETIISTGQAPVYVDLSDRIVN